jgi:hypothetical protein
MSYVTHGVMMGVMVGLLTLTGCATHWSHPTKSMQEQYTDAADCDAKGGQAAGAEDRYGLKQRQATAKCLLGKGYTRQ